MATRKLNKALNILVHPDLVHSDEIQELIRKGHSVEVMTAAESGFDIIFGKNCWRMNESLAALIEVSVKACRSVKYAKKRKEVEEEDE